MGCSSNGRTSDC